MGVKPPMKHPVSLTVPQLDEHGKPKKDGRGDSLPGVTVETLASITRKTAAVTTENGIVQTSQLTVCVEKDIRVRPGSKLMYKDHLGETITTNVLSVADRKNLNMTRVLYRVMQCD